MRRRSDFATFADLLQTRARETPDGLAYVFLQDGEEEAERLTFAELDLRARALAAWLERRQPVGERALLLFPPGLDFVAAFFGCLYAGAVAVPSYPPAPVRPGRGQPRLRAIVEDAAPRFVLTTAGLASRLDALAGEMPGLGAAERLITEEVPAGLADTWDPPAITSDTIAFLQYTSGSTSDPKGVMVSHGNLLHNEEVIRAACGHDERSTFVSWLPMYHDMGLIGGVLQPLYTGAACVLMAPVAFLQRPVRWLRAISRWRAHTSGAPDFAYDLCVRKIPPAQRADLDLSSWRIAFDGSEPVRARTLAAFTEAFSPCGFRSSAFFPCYGLAEATLIVSGEARAEGPLVEPPRQHVACGPVGLGLDVSIVDPERLEPVPPGAEGEIWVAGPSVARGYWNQPELSEQTFGARLAGREERFLRTGDLGFLRDGRLFVTGRLKDLIIVRGRNHYPQDLELTAADSHQTLRGGAGAAFAVDTEHGEAVVVVQEVDVRRRPDSGKILNEALGAVRQALAEEHELPVQAILLVRPGGVPKTTSGKVQRALCKRQFLEGLLEPLAEWRAGVAGDLLPETEDATPDTPESRAAWLRRRVAAKLGLAEKDIDPAAPLTRYGLDSLTAVELAHEIETGLGVEIPLATLLEGRSLESLAADLPLSRAEEGVGEGAGGEGLSPGERALWFLQRLDPASPAYHIAGAARLNGEVDEDALRSAFQRLVDRHPALRTTFFVRDGEPVRRIHPEATADFQTEDAASWRPEELAERIDAEIFLPFDLTAGPLLRVRILRRGPAERILVLGIHHIVADFWSLALMLRELGGPHPPDPPLPSPSRPPGEGGTEDAFAFWQERLADFPFVLELPLDHPRRAWPAHRAASVPFALQEGTAELLKALGRERGPTLFTVLLATFQALLHRVTGEERLLVGAPTSGRSRAASAEQVGYFVNPVVLPSEAVDDPSFVDFLAAARRTVLDAFAHEVPFPALVERLQPERDPGRTPLFQAAFVLQKALRKEEGLAAFALNLPDGRLTLEGLALESISLPRLPGQFDLTLVAAEIGGTVHLSFFYDVELFDRTTLERLAGHLRHLAAAVAARPDLRLSEIPLWSEAERWQVVGEWNDTAAPVSCVLIHERVAARAAAALEAIAIGHGERMWTYRELTRRAWGLAWRLRALGVGPEVRVAVLTERRPEMVVGSLAVLAAGGAYVPLDPAAPPERLARLMRDSGARVLLTEREPGRGLLALPAMSESGAATVVMEEVPDTAEEPPSVRVGRQNLAYIMYTSGSTGEPKGVETEHAAMVSFVDGYIAETNLGPVDVSGQLSGLAFDGSVMDMWPALTVGGSVRLPDEETRVTPDRLRDWMVAEGITVCFLPTPLFEAMLGLAWPAPGEGRTPRLLLVGGARLRLRPEPDLPFSLVNVYGPTETTVLATGGRVTPAGAPGCPERMPALGRPMPAMRIYLLDTRLQPVPVGSPGELCLTGGLARGYLAQPAQTAERFLPNPFGLPGTRLYRSGDLARWLPDGKLEFLGRTDHQVKVRGFRIEPGEIERTLTRHAAVREALVLAADDGAGGKRLVAFVAPPLAGSAEPAALRAYLTAKLPQFMIPSVFVVLPGLPRTVNGKIDRRALEALAQQAGGAETEAAAPRDPLEEVLAGLWAEVLEVPRVGIHDDFFALGGHSLLGARLISSIHTACGFEVPLRMLFEAPTVARLAEALSAEGTLRRGREPIPRTRREGVLPLSFGQERLWFLDRLQPGGAAYNVPLDLRLTGRLVVPILARSLEGIVRRHEALRTSFPEIDGRPVQSIHPPGAFMLPSIDLAGLPADVLAAEADRIAQEAARRTFDLENGPLLRATLLRCGAADHHLLLVLHHIVSDGASLQILLPELADGLAGRSSPLSELAVQPADVAAWERSALTGEALAPGLAFWAGQLAGAPALELPADRPRPAAQTEHGGLRSRELPADLAADLTALARRERVTPFMLFLAAFEILLARWSGQDDFVIGTPVAHRGRPELEPLIGLLVGSVALRIPLAGDPDGRELLGRVRRVTLEAFHHAGVPFEKIVERLQPERSLSRNPIFQTLFTVQPEVPSRLELPELTLEARAIENGTAKFDLSLFVRESQGTWIVTLEHSRDLFEATTAERLLAGFARLLAGLAATPESRISDLPLLSETERSQLLEWSRGAEPEPAAATLHGLAAAQVERTPDAVAVIWQTERLTYRQLWDRVETLAGRLREQGAGPEQVIGVRLPRTPELIVALLAVLESGAAYLPLDPAYPEERLAFLVEDAGAAVVIGKAAHPGPLPLTPSPVRAHSLPPRTGVGEATGGSLAYIIYTSGSTGRPKGVAIEHASAVRLVAWAGATFTRDELAGVLASTSVSFDLSVFEIFAPLAWGGTVILADDALAFPSLPSAEEVTLINTVPSAMAALLELWGGGAPLPLGVGGWGTRGGGDGGGGGWAAPTVCLAGEPLRRTLVDRLYAAGARRVFNLYGPSEDTTYSTGALIERDEPEEPTIGGPVAGSRAYVVDGALGLVPLGVAGELCLGGGGLARGYLGRPELTAERFVPDPFGATGGRLYRTGDRVRRRADGALMYLGRFDHQVKIRGFRIEPGEIETALLAIPGVMAAAVVPAPGGDRLAAFAVPRTGEALDGGSLREVLRGRLPAQLVPASVMLLETLPLTPNGKIDRTALARLAEPGKASGGGFVPPRGPVEELLAGLFAELLGSDPGGQVGAHDDFFALGGHSLLATRVVSRVRAVLGAELPLRAVFEAPTVAGLALRVEAARHAVPDLQEPLVALSRLSHLSHLSQISRGGDLPLSFAQQRLWFLHRLDPASAAYHIPAALHLAGRLDAAALERTLELVTERHEALRTTFTLSGEEPVQRIAAAPDLRLPVVDLSALPAELRREAADRIAVAEGRRAFDLERGPLLRALLVRLAPEEHILAVCFHHIIADGWSFGVLLREIGALYPLLAAGEVPAPLPPLPVQVADFAVWQRRWLQGDALRSRLAWWEERLAGSEPALNLPTDRPRPARPPEWGRTLRFRLGAARTAAVEAVARREGATPFMVLLAAWQAFLQRITGQDDISVGSPIANRNRAEIEGLIGYFVNTLVLRARITGTETFRGLLAQVRETALGAYDHQDLPFELLVEALRPGRDAGLAPLTQVLFVLQNAGIGSRGGPRLELPGLRLALLPVDIGAPKLDLALALEPDGDELAAALEYPLELFDPPTLARWAGSFDRLLAGALADSDLPLGRLPLLGAAELHQIVAEWNPVPESEPETPESASPLLHERFAAWAARTPDAPAVSFERETLTYRELDRRANQLAHHLVAAGVVPGARVGLWLERSVEVLVGILGILKAGAAWVPLDSNYPLARLAAMAADAGLGALVTTASLAAALSTLDDAEEALPRETVRVLLDADRAAIERRPGTPLDLPLPGNALAYVIYTSGSTGRPKGVACHHAGVINLIADLARWPLPPGAAGSLFASLSFDPSVYEIFSMLLNGGRLEVAPERVRGSGRWYGEWLRERRLENVFVPPTMLADLRDVMAEGGVRIRRLLVGIEPIAEPLLAAMTELSPGLVVLNGYGPTETTVVVTEYPVTGRVAAERNERNTPIGRPVLNMRAYLLGRELDPVPVGVPGELYAAGPQVAWGYLGRPDLTAERFLPDPCAGSPGERMYRTGDLARWLPDGQLTFGGRRDRQVKVRGVRVEPGEIEAALRGAPGVRDCLVAPRLDPRGERRLVAWVVGKPAAPRDALRDHLRSRLPEVMVPAAFVHLDALPLTSNGKVDRAALPDPDWQRPELRGERVTPRTPVEETLAGIWQDLLGVAPIGIHDSFFDLGGHSLKAGQLVLRVRDQLGVELPVRTVFEAPSVAELAVAVGRQLLAETAPPAQRITRRERPEEPAPLSFGQQQLWFMEQMSPGSAVYNLPAAVRCAGDLRIHVLERCLAEIERRHEALRTRFPVLDGRPVQVIVPPRSWRLAVRDLTDLPEPDREREADRLAAAEARRPFDLASGRLLRAGLLRLAPRRHVLLLTLHHLGSDAWSAGLLIRELAQLYAAFFAADRRSPLPEPAIQYADFAAWQRERLQGETLDRLLAFWRQSLGNDRNERNERAGFELPTDHPRPAVQTFRGAVQRVEIDAATAGGLRRLAAAEGTSLFAAALTVFCALLVRWSGQDDLRVGTAAASRPDLALEGLLGLFINTVVLRADLAGDPTFRAALATLRETTLGAFSHAELPFQQLVEALQPERDLSRSPLFQVFFSLTTEPLSTLELPDLTMQPLEVHTGATEFDLAVYLTESPAGVGGWIDYNADLFTPATLERFADRFAAFAAAAAADPDRRISELPLLSEADAGLLEGWSEAGAAQPSADRCLHEMFAAQAARTPDAPAAVHRDRAWTYRELAGHAAALAGRLRALGVEPGDRVGVCAERSLPMLAALLGVLETGAAYVPLDPSYPEARLAAMLADSGAAALVVHGERAERLAVGWGGVVVMAEEKDPKDLKDLRDINDGRLTAGATAYVLYTSGSTGAPKGVVVSHRNVAGFFTAMDEVLGTEAGAWLAVTSISFDISVLELLWTVTRGWKVVIQDDAGSYLATAPRADRRPIDFSLFYFADASAAAAGDKYRLLLEGARFADDNGFKAVWTPERHFHAFGGLYPNPSVTGAAVAAVTRRVAIRAGSVVLPLHDPVRVAEEWAVVDNLSGGRAGISFASGWHAGDFVFAPDHFADRHAVMFRGIETVRALWRGEAVRRRAGAGQEVDVRVLPRPVQPELPVWVTAAGSPATFRSAGTIGAHVLTHLLGQTAEEVGEKIAIYRAARKAAGHPGEGTVTLMLHTFVGADDATVRDIVRGPFTAYLRSSYGLVEILAGSLGLVTENLSEADRDALLEHAFDRYFETSGLFGSPATCLRTIDRLRALGVDEIGCLIDFGIDIETTLAGLRDLAVLRAMVERQTVGEAEDFSLPAQIARHGVTHLQCTPSLAGLLAADPATLAGLAPLRTLLLGGEALPAPLAARLHEALPAAIHNMYGPTETTIWSLTQQVEAGEDRIAIGRPLASNTVHVLDRFLQPVPPGVPGEICLGGDAVSLGYWNAPERTAERFVPDPFAGGEGVRLYRTGDLGRFRPDGSLDFLGRVDHQVKVRGHRIELGEIEAALRAAPGVRDPVVVARDASGGHRLAAYVVPTAGRAEALRPRGELAAARPRFALPNGMTVTYVTEFQVANGYQEIFEDEIYLRHGITLPDGACVLDVGANIGFFSLFVHQRSKGARVFAFEPFPATFEALRGNVELYGLDVRLFNRGVAERPGQAEFTFYPNAPGLSGRFAGTAEDLAENRALVLDWLERSGAGASITPEQIDEAIRDHLRTEVFPVELISLSDVIREQGIEKIDLLKVDAEKSEADILAGLRDEDWAKIDQVVLEVHSDELLEKVSGMLRAHGFDIAVDDFAVAAERDGQEAVRVTMVYAIAQSQVRDQAAISAGPVTASTLRRWLGERLPEPMIPADFVLLDALPLTGSGKVDRRALPAPESGGARFAAAYVAPRTSAEETIATVWQSVLGRDRVGIDDNFFEVGGSSLLLVQIHARLREALGREVTMVQLFRHPTIRALARFVSGADSETREPAATVAVTAAEERVRKAEAVRQTGTGAADRQKQFLEERRKQKAAGRRPGGPR
ncbi:MAG TPA: amino acid adenylation domain-containing protein [Thermoanaerobaculia bacterium]|nr:amino acid adenylation domain-containing protein [Thermoanaerobaculia bacterium]